MNRTFTPLSIGVGALALGALVSVFVFSNRDHPARANRAGKSSLEAPDKVDLGIAARDSTVNFEFEIFNNDSNDAVAVTRVAVSCGCTEATLETPIIGAGERSIVRGQVQSPELATGLTVRVVLLDGERMLSETRLNLISADPITSIAVGPSGDTSLTVDKLYDVDAFDWKIYSPKDDSPLDFRIAREDRGGLLQLQWPSSVDRLIVVFTNHQTGHRFAQEVNRLVSS